MGKATWVVSPVVFARLACLFTLSIALADGFLSRGSFGCMHLEGRGSRIECYI